MEPAVRVERTPNGLQIHIFAFTTICIAVFYSIYSFSCYREIHKETAGYVAKTVANYAINMRTLIIPSNSDSWEITQHHYKSFPSLLTFTTNTPNTKWEHLRCSHSSRRNKAWWAGFADPPLRSIISS